MPRTRGNRILGIERSAALEISSRQFGVISWRQLIDEGVGRGRIDSWARTGYLFPIFTGVYSVGRPVTEFRSIGMAAVLAAGPGAMLSDQSAAAVYGLVKPTRTIHVSRPTRSQWTFEGLGHHQRFIVKTTKRAVSTAGASLVGPIPVCALWRVLVDLSARMKWWEFRRVFLEAGRTGLLTPDCLSQCRQLTRGRRGRLYLVELIDLWGPDTGMIRSVLEAEFRMFCGEYRFERPETNQYVAGYEVDALWRDQGVAIELDGRQFHGDGAAFEADRTKGNAVAGEGITLLRVTDRMLKDDRQRAGLARTLESLGITSVDGR